MTLQTTLRQAGEAVSASQRARTIGAAVTREFRLATAAMRTIRESAAKIDEAVGDLASAGDSAGGGAGCPTAGAGELADAIGAAVALADGLRDEGLVRACSDLTNGLQDAALAARELGVISMMTRIALAGTAWDQAEAEAYTSTLDSLTARLADVVAEAERLSSPIFVKRRDAAREVCEVARGLAAAHERVKSREAQAAALRGDRDASLNGMRAAAQELAARVGAQIAALVPTLQFADELEQRIDHATRILDAEDAPSDAVRAAAPTIASAQMTALAEDCGAAHQAADAALKRLAEAVRTAGSGVFEGASNPAARWLAAQGEVVDATAAATASALESLGRAEVLMEGVFEAAAGASAVVGRFRALIGDLRIAASNASVASARSSNRASVLNLLAGSVAEAAKRCAASLNASAGELEAIRNGLPTEARRALAERLGSLAHAQEEARAASVRQREGLLLQQRAIGRLASASSALAAAAEDGLRSIARGRAHDGELSQVAASLAEASRVDVSEDALGWAARFYTTEAERRAGVERLGATSGEPDAVAADEADDDLDGFLM